MKTEALQIVDHGRGPQLSSSRITVQDLLPYYREDAANEEIRRWIPSLSDEEITLLRPLWQALSTTRSASSFHVRISFADSRPSRKIPSGPKAFAGSGSRSWERIRAELKALCGSGEPACSRPHALRVLRACHTLSLLSPFEGHGERACPNPHALRVLRACHTDPLFSWAQFRVQDDIEFEKSSVLWPPAAWFASSKLGGTE
jgi:hypothetical protein